MNTHLADHRNRGLLALGVSVTAFVWLFLLPALARTDAAARHLDWLDAKRIDPSAMFYTELECVEGLLRSPQAAPRTEPAR